MPVLNPLVGLSQRSLTRLGCRVVARRALHDISNRRLIAADDGGVSFRWKDYRLEGPERWKTMTLSAHEFIRRFLIHVLPKGFHRIRHYGLFANGNRAESIAKARELLSMAPPMPKPQARQGHYRRTQPPTPAQTTAIMRQATVARRMFDWQPEHAAQHAPEITAFLRGEAAIRGPERSVFTVTARDLAFVFYTWGLINRAQLQDTLENAWNIEISLFPRAARNRAPVPPRPSPPVLLRTHADNLKTLQREAVVPQAIYMRRLAQLNAFNARLQVNAMNRFHRNTQRLARAVARRDRFVSGSGGD